MIELQRLSPGDGIEIYDLLQSIPMVENGLQNKINGKAYCSRFNGNARRHDVDFPPRKWYYGHIKNVGGKRYFAPNK